jgi:hypothetical protein
MKRLCLLCIVALFSSHLAIAQDGPPVDTKAVLASLKQIKAKKTEAARAQYRKVIQELLKAAGTNSSAMQLYREAVFNTQFKGQPRENTLFQEWRRKEGDNQRSPEMQTAVRLHLYYLAYSLQRSIETPINQIVPNLIVYADELSQVDPKTLDQEFLKTPLPESLFVNWYNLKNPLATLKDWELTPGNADGIWQRTILPQLRRDKDPRAVAYWDRKLKSEADDATASRLAINNKQFAEVRKPVLLFSRAQEMATVGLPNRAMQEIFTLVRTYPDHPESERWVSRLEKLIAEATAPTKNPPAQASNTNSGPNPATPAIEGTATTKTSGTEKTRHPEGSENFPAQSHTAHTAPSDPSSPKPQKSGTQIAQIPGSR